MRKTISLAMILMIIFLYGCAGKQQSQTQETAEQITEQDFQQEFQKNEQAEEELDASDWEYTDEEWDTYSEDLEQF